MYISETMGEGDVVSFNLKILMEVLFQKHGA